MDKVAKMTMINQFYQQNPDFTRQSKPSRKRRRLDEVAEVVKNVKAPEVVEIEASSDEDELIGEGLLPSSVTDGQDDDDDNCDQASYLSSRNPNPDPNQSSESDQYVYCGPQVWYLPWFDYAFALFKRIDCVMPEVSPRIRATMPTISKSSARMSAEEMSTLLNLVTLTSPF